LFLMGLEAYRFSVPNGAWLSWTDYKASTHQMPEPSHFLWGTAAMGICGVVAMADKRVGVVMAWGLLIGAWVIGYNTQNKVTATATANANPSAQQVTTTQGQVPQ
jgi:hypothetical protein